jgi:predicted RNA-binding Zn ribbon-like protein
MVETMGDTASSWTFDLSGGALCLDLANTVSGKRGVAPIERIHTYEDLVSWSRQAGIVTERQANQLLREGRRRPVQSAAALRRALELREALYRIWSAIAQKKDPAGPDIELLNATLSQTLGKQRLKKEQGRWAMGWSDEVSLDSMLRPVAKSAADLLVSEDASRVRVCELTSTDECDWLFLDETKNRARRWCSMDSCGNRAKARRHYERKKASAGSP